MVSSTMDLSKLYLGRNITRDDIERLSGGNSATKIVLEHLFKNEVWLGNNEKVGTKENKADGTLDTFEIASFLNKIDKMGDVGDGNGTITIKEIEEWKRQNNQYNSHGKEGEEGTLRSLSAQQIMEAFSQIFNYQTEAPTPDVKISSNMSDTNKAQVVTKDLKNAASKYAGEYDNLTDNFGFVTGFYLSDNMASLKDTKFSQTTVSLFLDKGLEVGGLFAPEKYDIAIMNADEDYMRSVFAHEFTHSLDYDKGGDGVVSKDDAASDYKSFGSFSSSNSYVEAYRKDIVGAKKKLSQMNDRISELTQKNPRSEKENNELEHLRNAKTALEYAMKWNGEGNYDGSNATIRNNLEENFATMGQYILENYDNLSGEFAEFFPECYKMAQNFLKTA